MKHLRNFVIFHLYLLIICGTVGLAYLKGWDLANNLAAFVVSLHMLLLVLSLLSGINSYGKAKNGELEGKDLDRFIQTADNSNAPKPLRVLRRLSATIACVVLAAAGWTWAGFFSLVLYWFGVALWMQRRELADELRAKRESMA